MTRVVLSGFRWIWLDRLNYHSRLTEASFLLEHALGHSFSVSSQCGLAKLKAAFDSGPDQASLSWIVARLRHLVAHKEPLAHVVISRQLLLKAVLQPNLDIAQLCRHPIKRQEARLIRVDKLDVWANCLLVKIDEAFVATRVDRQSVVD